MEPGKIPGCRSCGAKDLELVLDLGETPLADRILTEEQLAVPEPTYPLHFVFCPECTLLQIDETVAPEELFQQDYPYYSSFSPALLEHSRENVLELIERFGLGPDSHVVELASNDGYLLKNYVEHGIPVLGIDPAEGPAREAEKIGVPTLVDFFGLGLATRLRADGKTASVIHANNVLAHVADTNGFVAGIHELLRDDGVAVIEAPYARDLVEHCEFDTIYHEHLCYFSVHSLDALFRRHGLYLNDVRRLSIHGGSLRLFVQRFEDVGDEVKKLLAEETEIGFDTAAYYLEFASRVDGLKETLVGMLRGLKADGKRLAAYGAAAKGATLINYMGIGTDLVDFVVDRNVHKQGRYMPGQRIPILAPEQLVERKPDHVLMLTWNFADEILAQQDEFRRGGGKFVIPVPEPRIV